MRTFVLTAAFTIAGGLALHAETYTLTMKQAVDRGLTRNPDVILAQLDALRATQEVRVQEDPFYPHVGAGSGLAYNNGMPLSIEGSAPSIVQARATEDLFNRPQHYAIAQQKEMAKSAAFGTQQKRDDIAFQIAGLYVDADRASRLLETARTQIESFQKVLDTIQARVEEGRELPIEGSQAKLNLTRARVRVSNLESDKDMAERNLAIALGYNAGDLVAPAAADTTLAVVLSPDEVAAANAAIEASPDVKRIQSLMVAKGLEITGIKSRRLPQVDLVAQYALFAPYNNIQQYFARFQRNNGELGASVQIPIFSGMGIKAALAPLETDQLHLQTELQSAKDKISMSVHQSYVGIERAKLSADLAKQDLDLARQRLTLVLDQMNDGRATLREVEQARIDENEKWIAFYDAQFTQERAKLDLLRQAGNLIASIQ